MSAYGTIPRPAGVIPQLNPLTFAVTRKGSQSPMGFVTVVPVKRSTVPDALFEHLHMLFNGVVEEGRTYPQEFELTEQSFEDYYFSYDCFIGVLDKGFAPTRTDGSYWDPKAEAWIRTDAETIDDIVGKDVKDYKELVVGMYYVKPNYPGRSSHCCNGGFIVDPYHRGAGYGYLLGMSYLYFAPRLGYLASVFNLVYSNNVASLKIWDKLGFTRAGLIPKAGRLRKNGDDGEEFVDAVVFWKSLVEDDVWTKRLARTEGAQA
ncbi:hypothetical protein DACRYDRAFT_24685 [Dacryopinax primogenitus]|uniref:N-acetyltransferase domain-containing protein n=1 Tax=Dacryopinax primogenitus (strain DJM 731) TaxID=1858805 RepID=M5FP45_DACPD|nr:uncharacterized protein DACRYDRAFT_24685 [Dacryopinax primogenitus]EJT98200.1 hypothetical protein DACRYDRAFT_24685 [Dacryopinax primogenitus]